MHFLLLFRDPFAVGFFSDELEGFTLLLFAASVDAGIIYMKYASEFQCRIDECYTAVTVREKQCCWTDGSPDARTDGQGNYC
jgi:hypothetical protein